MVVEMQFFGSGGASRSEPNIGAQIDAIIKEQAQYTEALKRDMEEVAQQIIHSGAEAMHQTRGRTDEFIQNLNTLVTKFFADAREIQMSMDGSTNVDVGAQLNWLEERTEEMVKMATNLAARYEAGSKTFDATLREAEAKIKEQTNAKLEESIQRYTEAIKQHAISVHKHTDAGPFCPTSDGGCGVPPHERAHGAPALLRGIHRDAPGSRTISRQECLYHHRFSQILRALPHPGCPGGPGTPNRGTAMQERGGSRKPAGKSTGRAAAGYRQRRHHVP